MERIIMHIDANNAFLSWTAVQMLKEGFKEDIRKIPAIIGGDEDKRRGIVIAKSEPAKKYGIKTGEPIYFAKQKCPNLQIFKSDYKTYIKYSNLMIEIFKEYTQKIEKYSIDECFLDMTNEIPKGKTIEDIANDISRTVKNRLGFTVNIGISINKILAKMASDLEKPDKINTIYRNEIEKKMFPLPISELFGIGKKSAPKLKKLGLNTIGDIAKFNKNILERKFGKFGKQIWEYSNGIDESKVIVESERPKGIGNSITLPVDYTNIEDLEEILLSLAEEVSFRLRKKEMLTNCINIQLKTNEFKNYSHQRKILKNTDSTKEIFNEGKILLNELYNKLENKSIRLIGLRVDTKDENTEKQMSLFDIEEKEDKKQKSIDNVIDNLKDKFGYDSVRRATSISKENRINPKGFK